jgi:hypothetical protein
VLLGGYAYNQIVALEFLNRLIVFDNGKKLFALELAHFRAPLSKASSVLQRDDERTKNLWSLPRYEKRSVSLRNTLRKKLLDFGLYPANSSVAQRDLSGKCTPLNTVVNGAT